MGVGTILSWAKMMKKTFICDNRPRGNCTGEKKKGVGKSVGGRSEQWVPARGIRYPEVKRGARAPTRYLVAHGRMSARAPATLTEEPDSSDTEATKPSPKPRTPPRHPAAAARPRPEPARGTACVSLPPPVSPSAAAPAPTLAAARPGTAAPPPPPPLGPRLTARGAPPAVAGSATLPPSTQTSSNRDRQLRAGCTSRRPSPRLPGTHLPRPI